MRDIAFLQEKARQLRVDTLEMIMKAGSGHVGGSYSMAELITALYYGKMNLGAGAADPDRDKFVLSKGHANPILYAVLADLGWAPKEAKETLRRYKSPFQGHPDSAKCPGLDCSTGSLGQGLSVATGMALGLKKQKKDGNIYVITGDGELQEGICWEAFMAAAAFGLDNLTVIIDRNRLQLSAPTEETNPLDSLEAKLRSFNFAVDVIDGHNFDEIFEALDKKTEGKPHCIIANTVKGKGVSFMENVVKWHGSMPTAEEAAAAFKELGVEYGK
ncbi:MAG: transketolase [Spirochaetales bacterium]|nr:transketolase [Candidatus Physcosoma equi]